MQMKIKSIIKELFWLIIPAAITILLISLVFTRLSEPRGYRIPYKEVSLTMTHLTGWIGLYSFTTFILYFTKEYGHAFKLPFANSILLISGSTLVVILSMLVRCVDFTHGITFYPPLAALTEVSDPISTSEIKTVVDLIIFIQMSTIALMLYVSFRWGGCGNGVKPEGPPHS